jgi:hypothetical protein
MGEVGERWCKRGFGQQFLYSTKKGDKNNNLSIESRG